VVYSDAEFDKLWIPLEDLLWQEEERYRVESTRPGGVKSLPADKLKEVYANITDASRVYLAANDEQRQRIRDLFRRANRLHHYVWPVAGTLIAHYKHTTDIEGIELALAALAIEDNHSDYNDTYVTLGLLYLALLRHGKEPRSFLEQAAHMASPEMQTFLMDFENSPYFQSEVSEKMKELREGNG
jgi:hypothetical protein